MSQINVQEIASRLINLHKTIGTEEIEQLVEERFNGKEIPLDELSNEIMMMVAELIGKIRGQDYKFMVDLVQSVADELQNND